MPEAATEKLAAAPSQTVTFAGGVVIDGGVLTVRTAPALVAELQAFVTTTSYVAGVARHRRRDRVRRGRVAPPMFTASLRHW